jgi:hypothetical protein
MDATTSQAVTDQGTYDEPYRFGRRPTARAPFPFTEQQFARLLILRGRVQDAASAADQLAA